MLWPESAWIEIHLPLSRSQFVIGCVYRPPSSEVEPFARAMEMTMGNLTDSNALVIGDFNAKCPSWLPSDKYNAAGRVLEPLFLQMGLHQCVESPTHFQPDGSLGSLLDLVLTTTPNLISKLSTLPPLGSSDHLCVTCHLNVNPSRSIRSLPKRIWNYEKADVRELNNALANADWNIVDNSDIDSALSAWNETFLSIVSKFVPSKIIRTIKKKNPFVNKDIETAIKEKHSALRRLKKNPSVENREAFRQKRNLVTHLLRKSERALATTLRRTAMLGTDSSTSHSFWKHMKDIQGKSQRTIIPTLVDPVDGSPRETAHEKASLLNAFFCQQTVLPGEKNAFPDTSSLISNRYKFDSLNCTPCEVHDIIAKLKPGKAPGLDYIPPRLSRLCAPGISASVAELFNLSFRTATFPSLWKKALVVPIHKKGNLKDPGNYRPIALLPILSKVLERIVDNKLSHFLSPWLSTNQSGFKRKDGTVPQLMRLTQTLSDAVDEQKYVGAVFFDLKKAFDRVWHKGLLAKIRFAGVTGGAHEWLASYLSERHQVTLVDGQLSSTSKLHAGVPQGAILSPLLFCVYMNDMPCRDSTNLFADDTSSYVIESNVAKLEEKLQLRTHNICIWFSKWLLSVNTEKSAIMVFRSRRMLPVCVQVFINKNIIPQVSSHRHLGLILHECLSWDCHIDHVVLKASAKLGFLRRLANRLDPLVIRDLYMFCILPAAEYASEVWSGLSTTDAIRLEKLNRRAARLILKVPSSSQISQDHDILLARAGLQLISIRRKLRQAMFCFKYFKGFHPEHLKLAIDNWLPAPRRHTMEHRSSTLRLPRPQKNILKNSPFYCAFSTWNSLPEHIRLSPTSASIKHYFLS